MFCLSEKYGGKTGSSSFLGKKAVMPSHTVPAMPGHSSKAAEEMARAAPYRASAICRFGGLFSE